jgi:hypothetical protein
MVHPKAEAAYVPSELDKIGVRKHPQLLYVARLAAIIALVAPLFLVQLAVARIICPAPRDDKSRLGRSKEHLTRACDTSVKIAIDGTRDAYRCLLSFDGLQTLARLRCASGLLYTNSACLIHLLVLPWRPQRRGQIWLVRISIWTTGLSKKGYWSSSAKRRRN